MDTRLQHRLYLVAKRLYMFQIGWNLALVWLVASIIGWGLLQAAERSELPKYASWIWLGFTAVGSVATLLLARLRYRDLPSIAVRIESRFPALNQRLITAVSLRPNSPNGRFGYLQRAVIGETLRHDFSSGWHALVPSSRMAISWCSNLIALGCLGAMVIALMSAPSKSPSLAAVAAEAVAKSELPIILPGDTSVERGSSVIVTAKFEREIPDEVWLIHTAGTGEVRLAMKRSLNDPIFAVYLYGLKEPLQYRVEYGGKSSGSYRIDVFEYPRLVRADARLEYPSYTGLEPKTIVDTRRVSAAVGTRLTWQIYLNKPVVSAELVEVESQAAAAEPFKLAASAEQPNLVEGLVQLTESKTWTLKLVDHEGRTQQQEVTLRARALPNEAAKIKLVSGGDVQVSPLQEFDIGAKINDDFGVEKAGIGYQFAGGDIVELEADTAPAGKEVKFSNLIDMESLKAETNQLLSYYVWAEERDEAGELRRSVSDIFFAEVRPLEEIFRQGEQPTAEQQQEQQQQQQQQSQGSEETEELLELQKQIIAGTWNVARTAKRDQLPEGAREDLQLLADSQSSAIEKLAEQAQESTVPGADEFIENAAQRMQQAAEQLIAAGTSLMKADVQQALANEQAAYQELLRLQSREHEVVRSQQSQGKPNQSRRAQARQQQLEQLELKNQENRYETEREAQEQQSEQQSEMRQVISRLRELAARQEDLNEQLREVEAALQTAKTEQEREELQRQLERLREQQQQMLQDSDELQERMESQSNSEPLQTAQDQMQQTRENLQQSAEALNQGNTSQALAAGTRAEQQLNQLQDEMRQQAANQFSETMQEMRQAASEVEQRQQQIVDQMSKSETNPGAGLRNREPEMGPQQQLDEQRKQVEQLLENMEQTVQQAEDAEPLLAQRLYDSYRKAQQQKIEERLEVTEQLLERSLEPQARDLAGQSLKDVAELRTEIDEAAQAVLGNEVDSLRLALSQIETLSEQLEGEISQATDQPPADRSGRRGESDPAQGASAQGEPGQGNPAQDAPAEATANRGEPNRRPSNTAEPDAMEQGAARLREGAEAEPAPAQPAGQQPAGQAGPQPAEPPAGQQPGQGGGGREGVRQPGLRGAQEQTAGASAGEIEAGGSGNRPFSGEGFREWSDRLRDVEELVSDPELRWQATQIRQAARDLRSESQRHSKPPEWTLVDELIATPLRELERKVSDELIRRAAGKNEIVPIDRDPVPSRFSRSVRQYYENLGSGR